MIKIMKNCQTVSSDYLKGYTSINEKNVDINIRRDSKQCCCQRMPEHCGLVPYCSHTCGTTKGASCARSIYTRYTGVIVVAKTKNIKVIKRLDNPNNFRELI